MVAVAFAMVTHGLALWWAYGLPKPPAPAVEPLPVEIVAAAHLLAPAPVDFEGPPEPPAAPPPAENPPRRHARTQPRATPAPAPAPPVEPVEPVSEEPPPADSAAPVVQQTAPQQAPAEAPAVIVAPARAHPGAGGAGPAPSGVAARAAAGTPAPARGGVGGAAHTGGYKAQPARLLTRTIPAYPRLARAARVQGRVELLLTVGKDGRVGAVKVLGGPRLLVPAAVASVKAWRFSPATNARGAPQVAYVPQGVQFSLH